MTEPVLFVGGSADGRMIYNVNEKCVICKLDFTMLYDEGNHRWSGGTGILQYDNPCPSFFDRSLPTVHTEYICEQCYEMHKEEIEMQNKSMSQSMRIILMLSPPNPRQSHPPLD
jgi:hypothetical protein